MIGMHAEGIADNEKPRRRLSRSICGENGRFQQRKRQRAAEPLEERSSSGVHEGNVFLDGVIEGKAEPGLQRRAF